MQPSSVLLLPGSMLLLLTACTSRPPADTPVPDTTPRIKSPAPRARALPPSERTQEHGVRIIFPSATEVRSGGKVAFTKGGMTYSENLPPLASARMCATRLYVLCTQNGVRAELDPPHAVRIFEEDIQVQTTNVGFGKEKF